MRRGSEIIMVKISQIRTLAVERIAKSHWSGASGGIGSGFEGLNEIIGTNPLF